VVGFVWKARPELLSDQGGGATTAQGSMRKVLIGLSAVAVLTGGALSWFASSNPDGLEWAMFKTSGSEELQAPEQGMHQSLAHLQEKTAFMPDYSFNTEESESEAPAEESQPSWPVVDSGTSVAGLVGGVLTLLMAGLIGFGLKRRRNNSK
jgi:cobalt/nickel transport system permease protein